MRSVTQNRTRIWSFRRKLLGNLISAIVGVPPAVVGVVIVTRTSNVFGAGLWWVVGAVVVTWIAVNFCGLFENSKMRNELLRRLTARGLEIAKEDPFVGCATPGFAGWLDPHEDVGFLRLEADRLVFFGDSLELVLLKKEITRVRFRPNVHTVAGLGRWVSVEGRSEGTKVRLLLEPRVKRTLLGNGFYSTILKRQILDWLKQ